jgi:acyl-CoA thioesterase-1
MSGMARTALYLPLLISLFLVSACRQPAGIDPAVSGDAPAAATTVDRPAAGAGAPLVVFLGDSLTAGFGLSHSVAFPAVTIAALRDRGLELRLVNAGVSGDTTAGGLSRLPWLLKQAPDVVVIALGANDGLRGLPVTMTERNLRSMIGLVRDAGAGVLLLAMRIPPSYGPEYTADFAAIYTRIAADLEVRLVESFLEGVGGRMSMNLGDGLHPNLAGHRRLAENLAPHLEALLRERIVS